ncbi:gluconokinase [Sphingobacterium griseoflavum]|uniref:Gluconate kinase n=1 Tax=Sphingobacterium griseoflavum TaxID=1474952 RepID=A0ABQ3HXQ0_9SPHI|nr:gluconokinase [Sphingobacterium griseoflavum]GHE42094.1 gluconate kinase [Sphingobacterium griseoflavum]
MIIGLDIGTSSTKAVAFDLAGEVLAQYSIPYPILNPAEGYYEQDPETIYYACIESLSHVMIELQELGIAQKPACIAVSSAMHGLIAVDVEGRPLTNCIIWADRRSEDIATELLASEEGRLLYQQTGTPIHPMSLLCKTMWMRLHEQELFGKTYKFIGIKELLFYRLFGVFVIDHSVASATGLFDIRRLAWSGLALGLAGIATEQLSTPVPVDYVLRSPNRDITALMRIPEDTPFVIAGSDGCLANLGVGAVKPGVASVTVGTSGAIRVVSPHPNGEHKQRLFSYLLRPNEYIIGGAVNNGGVLRNWFRDNFLTELTQMEADKDATVLLNEIVDSVVPGAEGLIFLPYLTGERAPYWNANAKGVYFGIQLHHSRAHFARAMMEGMLYAIYSVGMALEENTGPIHTIYASGGLARSAIWVQMLSDIFNKPVLVANTVESSAWGAALIGMDALGLTRDTSTEETAAADTANHMEHYYMPSKENHAVYRENFKQFERLYQKLEGEF